MSTDSRTSTGSTGSSPWPGFVALTVGGWTVTAISLAGRLALLLTGTAHAHATGGPLTVALAVLSGGLRQAWQPAPPAAVFWPVLGLLWTVPLAAAGGWAARRVWRGAGLAGTARWATGADERRLALPTDPKDRPGRLVAGYGRTTRRLVGAEDCISAVVFGPNGSGKTTSLLAPNAVEWTGPLVITTTKPADVNLIHAARSAVGPVWVIAPAGCPPHQASCWSPVDYCTDLPAADRMADWLIEASGMTADPRSRAWHAQARKYLAPLLLAARLSGGGTQSFVRWVYDGASAADDVTHILSSHGQDDARRLYASTWTIHDEGQGSVLFTAYGLADAYARPDLTASTARTDLTPAGLLDKAGTLIVVCPESDADRLAGYSTALLAAVVHEAEHRAARAGGPLTPRLGMLIDEAATMFRFPRLTSLLTTARGNGIQLLLVYHDLAQLDALYSPAQARTVLSNAKLRILLPGQGDTATLDYFSRLAGQALVTRTGQQHGHDGKRSHSTSQQTHPLAPVHALAQLAPGTGIALYPGVPPIRLRLRPIHTDRPLKKHLAALADRTASP